MTPALLPREHPDAPKYWQNEINGGPVAAAVRSYLEHPAAMTLRELAYMRAYLSQWIQSPVWDFDPHQTPESRAVLRALREGVGAIKNAKDVSAWLHAATEAGFDPL